MSIATESTTESATTEIASPQSFTIWGLIEERARLTPHASMLIDEGGVRRSYAEMLRDAETTAAWLWERGVRAGDTVSWQLPTSVISVVVAFALARIGAKQNPIIPLYRRREVAAMVEQCDSSYFITLSEFRGFDHAGLARELADQSETGLTVFVLDAVPEASSTVALPPPPEDSGAVRWIYTTSGTSSAPKGVCHSDRSLIAGALGVAETQHLGANDVASIFFPFAHIGGPNMLLCATIIGIPVVLMAVFDVAQAVDLMCKEGVSISGGAPAFYSMFLAEKRRRQGADKLVPSLRLLSGGAAAMSPTLFYEAQRELEIAILHGYGMTECPMITMGRFEDTEEHRALSVGQSVAGCEIEVRTSSEGQWSDAGEVWLRGPMLFEHYLVDGEVVRPHDEGGWFYSGDIGYLNDTGHLFLVGREKDLIIRNGESISPVEIEDVLSAHAAIADVAVIGLPDERRGELICAVICVTEGASTPTMAELIDLCHSQGLSPGKLPERIEVIDAMPKTPTLKTLKRVLKDRFSI